MATATDAGQSLVGLESALNRPLGDFLGHDSPWPAAFFSDTPADEVGRSVADHPYRSSLGWSTTSEPRLISTGCKEPDQRRALLLRTAGYSCKEIAAHRGWTYSKVDRCVRRGRATLRAAEALG